MPISDEELIAYLLGDANPQDRRRIESGLANDENLRARINELRMVLGQLDTLQFSYDPPADLLASTMARIDAASSASEAPSQAPTPSPVGLATSGLSAAAENRAQRGTWDSTALVICSTLLFCLFLPTVLKARFESRRAQCSHQLQYLGRGLIELASLDPQQRFPAVAVEGYRAFSGMYAINLSDFGLVRSPAQLNCVSLEGCRPTRGVLEDIPTLAQLATFDGPQLELCRNAAGGDYDYNLGVVEDRKIVAPRYEGRTHFAMLGDSSMIQNSREEMIAHDGRGLNIFFEDGHVAFFAAASWQDEIGDNPFCNIRQEHAVGLNRLDASLGPSHFGPLGND